MIYCVSTDCNFVAKKKEIVSHRVHRDHREIKSFNLRKLCVLCELERAKRTGVRIYITQRSQSSKLAQGMGFGLERRQGHTFSYRIRACGGAVAPVASNLLDFARPAALK